MLATVAPFAALELLLELPPRCGRLPPPATSTPAMISAAATTTMTIAGTSQPRSVRTNVGGLHSGGVWSTVATGVAIVASPGLAGVKVIAPVVAPPRSAASIAARNSAAVAYRSAGSRAIARRTTSSSAFDTPARTLRGRIGS